MFHNKNIEMLAIKTSGINPHCVVLQAPTLSSNMVFIPYIVLLKIKYPFLPQPQEDLRSNLEDQKEIISSAT